MRCAGVIGGTLYFGTSDGFVCLGLYGDKDGADINGDGGNSIEGDVQTSFQAFNTPAQLKKFGMVRPSFIALAAPAIKLQINTQFQFNNVGGSPFFLEDSGAVWDAGFWNFSTWVGNNTYQAWAGTTGLGYYGSLRMKVRGLPLTVFTACNVMTELGGVM